MPVTCGHEIHVCGKKKEGKGGGWSGRKGGGKDKMKGRWKKKRWEGGKQESKGESS